MVTIEIDSARKPDKVNDRTSIHGIKHAVLMFLQLFGLIVHAFLASQFNNNKKNISRNLGFGIVFIKIFH